METRKIACLALAAVLLATMAVADSKGKSLDGTTWKIDVEPDKMAREKGEREFKDTITFADGKISMVEVKKMGFDPSCSYSMSKSGDNDWTFTAEQESPSNGKMVWTGVVHGNDLKGKLIWTKSDATVLTYTFHGNLNT